MAKTLLEGLNGWVQRNLYSRVCRLTKRISGQADEAEAKAIAQEAAAPPGTIDVMSHCLAEIAQKYDWLGQWTPEAMLLAAAGTWAVGTLGVWKRLDALEARYANPAKPPADAEPPAEPNPRQL
jgi:hypothetical protein